MSEIFEVGPIDLTIYVGSGHLTDVATWIGSTNTWIAYLLNWKSQIEPKPKPWVKKVGFRSDDGSQCNESIEIGFLWGWQVKPKGFTQTQLIY